MTAELLDAVQDAAHGPADRVAEQPNAYALAREATDPRPPKSFQCRIGWHDECGATGRYCGCTCHDTEESTS